MKYKKEQSVPGSWKSVIILSVLETGETKSEELIRDLIILGLNFKSHFVFNFYFPGNLYFR